MTTRIEWTQETWNPVKGCTKISAGCAACYAERMARRLQGKGIRGYEDGFSPKFMSWQITKPFSWKRPRMVFVASMGDLFHDEITDQQRDDIFGTMALLERHTFQVLTKRPEKMREYLDGLRRRRIVKFSEPTLFHFEHIGQRSRRVEMSFPLSNVWFGVTTETPTFAERRIPILLDIPAKIRFVSVEPMLARVSLERWLTGDPSLDWVIVGGLTGVRGYELPQYWVRRIRDECLRAGVPFFFKRWGGRRKGARLDMREWREWPNVGD